MYLQEIGAVSLLTREQEVEIAKQIEEGEYQVREHVLNRPFTLQYVLDLRERIRAGEMNERDLLDEEAEEESDEENVEAEAEESDGAVLKTLDKIHKLHTERDSLAESVTTRKPGSPKAKQEERKLQGTQQRLRRVIDELQLGRRHITTIVDRLSPRRSSAPRRRIASGSCKRS
jgi:RNA polymerase primary sigma factor